MSHSRLIRAGDLDGVVVALEKNPDLLHTYDVDDWEELSALHCAARYGHLDIVKLLADRGTEVYSNPLSTYPAIFIADRYRYYPDRPNAQHIVKYFLNEIPQKAVGTESLGVTIDLAAWAGWTDIVRKYIEIDPLSVHHRQSKDITTVAFSADADQLRRCRFLVVCYGSNEGDVGYYLNLKDYLDMENPVTEK